MVSVVMKRSSPRLGIESPSATWGGSSLAGSGYLLSHSNCNHSNRNHSNCNHSNRNHSNCNHSNRNHNYRNHSNRNHTYCNHSNCNHTYRNHSNRNHTYCNHSNCNHTYRNHSNRNHTYCNHSNCNHTYRNHSNCNHTYRNRSNCNHNYHNHSNRNHTSHIRFIPCICMATEPRFKPFMLGSGVCGCEKGYTEVMTTHGFLDYCTKTPGGDTRKADVKTSSGRLKPGPSHIQDFFSEWSLQPLSPDGRIKMWVYGATAGGFILILFIITVSFLFCSRPVKQSKTPSPPQKALALAYDGDVDM
ncbi:hypothetical protein NFI96_000528 [Prochilodus magdalenae]|nr:hypothetical protein NFI96_000528 [Prochilodus magdalenae]